MDVMDLFQYAAEQVARNIGGIQKPDQAIPRLEKAALAPSMSCVFSLNFASQGSMSTLAGPASASHFLSSSARRAASESLCFSDA